MLVYRIASNEFIQDLEQNSTADDGTAKAWLYYILVAVLPCVPGNTGYICLSNYRLEKMLFL